MEGRDFKEFRKGSGMPNIMLLTHVKNDMNFEDLHEHMK